MCLLVKKLLTHTHPNNTKLNQFPFNRKPCISTTKVHVVSIILLQFEYKGRICIYAQNVSPQFAAIAVLDNNAGTSTCTQRRKNPIEMSSHPGVNENSLYGI